MRQAVKEPLRILFVCLGNICRSPTAEGALRRLCAAEAPELDIEVDSAGTGDYHLGKPPDSRSRRAAAARGIDLSPLRARQVERQDFARFDLILAMDRHNLRALRASSCSSNLRAARPTVKCPIPIRERHRISSGCSTSSFPPAAA
jgi:protein-tyrosine-phosphatase